MIACLKQFSLASLHEFLGEDLVEQLQSEWADSGLLTRKRLAEMIIQLNGIELIKKAETELFFYEEKLCLARKFREAGEHAAMLRSLTERYALPSEVVSEIAALQECVG
jgi:hypothetical protein